MRRFDFPAGTVLVEAAWGPASVRAALAACLGPLLGRLPPPGSPVLIHASLQAGFPGLGGWSADLRVVAALLELLAERGHHELLLGDGLVRPLEGPAPSTFRRQRVDRLARRFGARLVDLSQGGWTSLTLGGERVRVADLARQVPTVLVPVVGVDRLLGLAGACSALLGAVHPEDRGRLLADPGHTLPALARSLAPRAVVADVLSVREGHDLDALRPVRFGRVVVGVDPLLVDLFLGRIFGVTAEEMPAVWGAIDTNVLDGASFAAVEEQVGVVLDLARPLRPWRDKGGAPKPVGEASLRRAGLLPEPEGVSSFAREDTLGDLSREAPRCGDCRRCEEFCPVGLSREEIGRVPAVDRCISCLYCYLACPKGALTVAGDAGALGVYLAREKALLETL